jgi:hypothetical protein
VAFLILLWLMDSLSWCGRGHSRRARHGRRGCRHDVAARLAVAGSSCAGRRSRPAVAPFTEESAKAVLVDAGGHGRVGFLVDAAVSVSPSGPLALFENSSTADAAGCDGDRLARARAGDRDAAWGATAIFALLSKRGSSPRLAGARFFQVTAAVGLTRCSTTGSCR